MHNQGKMEWAASDKRFFIRFHTVFPIEFRMVNTGEPPSSTPWLQGYTNNLSRGGLCLETVFLTGEALSLLEREGTLIEMSIRVPFSSHPVTVSAKYVWFRADHREDRDKFYVGAKFFEISSAHLSRLITAAKWYSLPIRSLAVWLGILICCLTVVSYYGFNLKKKNDRLIKRYVKVSQTHKHHLDEMEEVVARKEIVIQLMEKQGPAESVPEDLDEEYKRLLGRERILSDKLKVISYQEDIMQKQVLNTMHAWLLNHQSKSAGLVKSFEGDVGIIKNWAFIYDQALAVNVFLLFENYAAAEDVLNFFRRELEYPFKGYSNAYYYDSEKVSEYTVHCGPNIWMGVAIMQYQDMTGNDQYLDIAEAIGQWLIDLQDADPAGGLKGGPEFSWYATEHNLDAYAFFVMLAEKTQKKKYEIAAKKTLSWLKKFAMVPHDRDYDAPPVKRGLGDSTVATDTYAWSLAAIGPDRLEELGMNPEEIMQFAQDHCEVTVQYKRPSGNVVDVSGFDFSKVAHMPRGGMVSPEWTSQMIVSYQMLSHYLYEKNNPVKARVYAERGQKYLRELDKLIITSPSATGCGEGCLPYATLEMADTGHGWDTPMGTNTCSIAGTAYTIMAMKEFNPLMFQKKEK